MLKRLHNSLLKEISKTNYTAIFPGPRYFYSGVTCLQQLTESPIFTDPQDPSRRVLLKDLKELQIYKGIRIPYLLPFDKLDEYKKILKKSCIGKYLRYHERHKVCISVPSTVSHATLILVVPFLRFTWDFVSDSYGKKHDAQIPLSIIDWYNRGFSADEAMVIGSFLSGDKKYYQPQLPGHAVFSKYIPIKGLAKRLPQILDKTENIPNNIKNYYLFSGVVREIQGSVLLTKDFKITAASLRNEHPALFLKTLLNEWP